MPGVHKILYDLFTLRANDNIIRAVIELRNAFKKQKTPSIRSKRPALRDDRYRLQILEETLRQMREEND